MKLPLSERQQMLDYIVKHGKTQSAWEIATNTGYGVSTIQQNATKLGIVLKPGDRILPKQQEIIERAEWIKENGADMTMKEMANHFKLTYSCIYHFIERYELPVKKDFPGRSYANSVLKTKKRKDKFYHESMLAY